jgi:uncharacterized protein with PQ loop repeat
MQLLEYQVVLGIIAVIIGFLGYIPYFRDIIKRQIKPHAFSWFIWGLLQVLVFFASTSRGGGAGAWTIAAGALLCLTIFVISIFRGEKDITMLDKASLVVALLGIALWVVTTDPVWSVIIATGVDIVGFVPTFRKAYKKPHEDSVTVFGLSSFSFFISLFALHLVNITTFLYPASLVASNAVFVVMVLLRRKALTAKSVKGKPKSRR